MRLNYLAGENQVNTATSYRFTADDLFMDGSKLSEFIESDVPSSTLLLIPSEFQTVFERLERLERTINTIFAARFSAALLVSQKNTKTKNTFG